MHWFTRSPIAIQTFDQYVNVFSTGVWIGVLIGVVLFALMFKLIHVVYSEWLNPSLGLAGPLHHDIDFAILTVSKLTESNVFPWFPKWTVGN